ncbi:hypothetical protein C8Q75DRAFT_775393 [Abortiporus biennis]|nr:hypothetical protein C8Q75DRAFT_775393 [Abortiporus biennis]
MWKRQMGRHRPRVIFILYLLCRYVGVIALIIPTASFFGHVSAAACPKFVAAGGSLRILLSECAALVLLWRTWAIWSMSSAILTFMSTLLVPVTIVSIMSITKQKSFMYAGHCTAVVSSHGIIGRKWVFSLVHLVYDTIAFLLSSWRLMMNVRLGASPISSALLRDGMIYYFCIVSAHILNLFWFTRTVPEQQNMTQLFSVACEQSFIRGILSNFADSDRYSLVTMIFSQRISAQLVHRVLFQNTP